MLLVRVVSIAWKKVCLELLRNVLLLWEVSIASHGDLGLLKMAKPKLC